MNYMWKLFSAEFFFFLIKLVLQQKAVNRKSFFQVKSQVKGGLYMTHINEKFLKIGQLCHYFYNLRYNSNKFI